jgi:hypothetical protein
MKPLGDPHRHIQLVNGMAQALGADLTGAAANGALSQKDYAGIVTRCRGCSESDACEARLRSPDSFTEAPSYCRNADVLAKLID